MMEGSLSGNVCVCVYVCVCTSACVECNRLVHVFHRFFTCSYFHLFACLCNCRCDQ